MKLEHEIPTGGEKDAFGVDRQGIDDSIVPTEVEDKGSLGTFPFLDVVATGGSRSEGIFDWVDRKCPNRFLVMSQREHGFAGCEVPQSITNGRHHRSTKRKREQGRWDSAKG